MSYWRLVHVGETLTDLQILGCELHKNAFGGSRTRWESYSAPSDSLAVIRGGERGKERVGNSSEGRKGKEKKGVNG